MVIRFLMKRFVEKKAMKDGKETRIYINDELSILVRTYA